MILTTCCVCFSLSVDEVSRELLPLRHDLVLELSPLHCLCSFKRHGLSRVPVEIPPQQIPGVDVVRELLLFALAQVSELPSWCHRRGLESLEVDRLCHLLLWPHTPANKRFL